MKIQGHRGSLGTYPENTLPAFQEAIDSKADGIELDLRIRLDGEVVIHHDPLPKDTSSILTLKELFFMLKKHPNLTINLELKEGPAIKVIELVRNFGYTKQVYYSSFDTTLLKDIRIHDKDATLAYLVEHIPLLNDIPPIHITIISPHEALLTKEIVQTFQNAGYRVIPWTVNDPMRAKELALMGIDEIITDYPRLFKLG